MIAFACLFTSADIRQQYLRAVATQSAMHQPIMEALEAQGYTLDYCWRLHAGQYIPQRRLAENTSTIAAKFHLPLLASMPRLSHDWLHELLHFRQDQQGLLFLPQQKEDRLIALLEPESALWRDLFCEAQAEVETLIAAYELAQHGEYSVWKGALQAKEWRALAKAYAAFRQHQPQEEARAGLYQLWFASPIRRYYEKQALQRWTSYRLPTETYYRVTVEQWKNWLQIPVFPLALRMRTQRRLEALSPAKHLPLMQIDDFPHGSAMRHNKAGSAI